MTTDTRYNQKYAENNITYAKEVIEWLVLVYLVGKTSNLKSGLNIQPHHDGWWFDWQKINKIADDVCDYCSSKRRKLKCGKIVNESKHNLSRYKTAVKSQPECRHFFVRHFFTISVQNNDNFDCM